MIDLARLLMLLMVLQVRVFADNTSNVWNTLDQQINTNAPSDTQPATTIIQLTAVPTTPTPTTSTAPTNIIIPTPSTSTAAPIAPQTTTKSVVYVDGLSPEDYALV